MTYRSVVLTPPRGPVGRLLAAVAALVLGVVAVFLFTAFAAVSLVLALLLLLRAWWRQGRGSRPRREAPLTVEYVVERQEVDRPEGVAAHPEPAAVRADVALPRPRRSRPS